MPRSFDVLYYGWSQAKGIWGDEFIHSVFHHIMNSRESHDQFVPEKLRISIKKKELYIMKEIFSKTTVRTFIEYQNISLTDVTYSTKIAYKGNVYVCLLVLGYDPSTGFPVHLYVYQTKNDEDALTFIRLIIRKTNTVDIRTRSIDIENKLIERGNIALSQLRYSNSLYQLPFYSKSSSVGSSLNSSNDTKILSSNNCSTKNSKDYVLQDIKSKVKPVHLLLPERDYDTSSQRNLSFVIKDNRYNDADQLPLSKTN